MLVTISISALTVNAQSKPAAKSKPKTQVNNIDKVHVLNIGDNNVNVNGGNAVIAADSVATQETPLLSYSDWLKLSQAAFGDVPYSYIPKIMAMVDNRFNQLVTEYNRKQQALKQTK